jgi:hypothetical protein
MLTPFLYLARPERFERPTLWFVAKYSIQLSYGRKVLKEQYYILLFGGERGIRTLDTDLSPYASLAGKCLRPLGQLSVLILNLLLQFEGVILLDSL